MTDEELLQLPDNARQIMGELVEIIPNWQKVNLTKQGYNTQYMNTLIDVAIYVLEKQKLALKEIIE